MVRRFKLFSAFMAFMASFAMTFVSCTDQGTELIDEGPRPGVKTVKYSLVHDWDTTRISSAADNMISKVILYTSETDSVPFTRYPSMTASIEVEKTDYEITEDLLNSQVVSSEIRRGFGAAKNAADTFWERDTLSIALNDGQKLTVPVAISSYCISYDNKRYYCGSDTLISGRLHSVRNLDVSSQTRSTYVSKTVNTEYTVELTFSEKNVSSPKITYVYLKGYAKRYVIADNDIDKVYAENKNREVIDATTEKCSFDEVIVMKNGDVNRVSKSIILNRLFKGIDPYDKFVSSFAYSFLKSNGLNNGSENQVRTEDNGNWTVWGRTNNYSADISNNLAAELIRTDYTLYHERAVYKDLYLEVDFGYEDIVVSEVSNNVSSATSDKDGYEKAVYNNAVRASYMGYTHDISEKVNLYKLAKVISGYEFRDAKLVISDDKVTASLIYVVTYNDGSEELHNESKEFARSLVCTTDWTAKEKLTDHQTGDISVSLQSTVSRSDGFWSYDSETRIIRNSVKLNSSTQTNSWTSVDPNSIIYTRNGHSCTFDVIEFTAVHKGDNLAPANTSGNISVYNYTDDIAVTFGDNTKEATAPGKILIDGKTVNGYEIRDEKLVVNDNNVIASLTFVTQYLDGTEDTEAVSKTFPRSLVCNSNWSSREQNAEQTTAAPTFQLSGSETVNDGNWSYLKETRTITAIASLNATSQENSWTAIDPNSIVYTREDITWNFQKLRFDVAYVSANTTLSNKVNLVETYKYTNTIHVMFGDNTVATNAPGTITVEKNREVVGHEFRNQNLVVNDNSVTASAIFVTKYNDGTEATENVSKTFARSLRCLTDWTEYSQNNRPNTMAADTSLKGSQNMTDGFWSYDNETYTITTLASFSGFNADAQTNGWEAVVPNNIVYTRDGVSCSFGKLQFSAQEKGADVQLTSQTDNEERYAYTDKIDVTYGSNTVTSTAPGTIISLITIVGYDFRNGSLTVLDGSVKADLVFVTKYSNGTEKTESVSKMFQRSFTTESNWKSTEANANQSTGLATVSLIGTSAQTDGFWSFNQETRSITTAAQLNSSTQNNQWKSVDPNSIVYTREGQTYTFDVLSFSAQESGSSVSVGSETDDMTTYNYVDRVNVLFGGNTLTGSAPGTIFVEKPWLPDFPEAWGKFVSATSTVSINESNSGWVYTWSLHFTNGTLPVIVRPNDTGVSINPSLFAYDTNPNLNSAVFINNVWINAIAKDSQHTMQWAESNGTVQSALLYSTATMWHWNNGHNTVYTSDFSFTISQNGSKLTVKKNGTDFAVLRTVK